MIATLAVVGCLMGAGQFTAPSAACTPGAYRNLTRAEVCVTKQRPNLPAAERRKILHRYGLTTWTGAMGELDHRVPVFLGGLTNATDVWPQRGPIPNLKDRLEFYVRQRICAGMPHPMTVRTGINIFRADWRSAYFYYGLDRK